MIKLFKSLFKPSKKPGIDFVQYAYTETYATELLEFAAQHFATNTPQLKFDNVDTYWAKFKVNGEVIKFYMDNYCCEMQFGKEATRDHFYKKACLNSIYQCKKENLRISRLFF